MPSIRHWLHAFNKTCPVIRDPTFKQEIPADMQRQLEETGGEPVYCTSYIPQPDTVPMTQWYCLRDMFVLELFYRTPS